MKASLYNERTDVTTEFTKVERLMEWMSDTLEVEKNDPMCTNETEFEFMGVEDGCAYFNMR